MDPTEHFGIYFGYIRRLVQSWVSPFNAVSKVPAYQIPRVDDSLEALAGSDTFCQLDMNSAYFQVTVNPTDRDKTTITTPFGTYRYTRMVFGLAGAPATCARLLDIVLGDITPP